MAILDEKIKNQLITIIHPEQYLDQPEALACYAYDTFVEESLPDTVIFPKTTN